MREAYRAADTARQAMTSNAVSAGQMIDEMNASVASLPAYDENRFEQFQAITRAKELLIVVGREEAVLAMTQNAQKNKRYTGLKLRLQGKAK